MVIIPTLFFTYLFARKSRRKASSVIRKVFHVAIVAVFITGIKSDISFLKFCTAALLVIFIILEVSNFFRLIFDL